MKRPIRIGSRGSQLALWQANHILYALRDAGYPVELEVIRTTGDRMQQPGFVAPPNLDGKGIFIKEIEEALESGRIDLAVHSLKDLPTQLAPQFTLSPPSPSAPTPATSGSANPSGRSTPCPKAAASAPPAPAAVPSCSPSAPTSPSSRSVATSTPASRSLKRATPTPSSSPPPASTASSAPSGSTSASPPEEMCPAPGQGALALETRALDSLATDDPDERWDAYVRQAVAFFEHPHTRFAVTAERAVLHALGGGCQLPIGAFCTPETDLFRLYAQVVAPDGEAMVQLSATAELSANPCELGESIAADLIAQGALELLTAASVSETV